MNEITTETRYRIETETHRLTWDGDFLSVYACAKHGGPLITTPAQARELAEALEAMAKIMEEKA